jgi:hypothetical protein
MQPFTKSGISIVDKTLAERTEIQLTLTDHSHFLQSMIDRTKAGDMIGTMGLVGKSLVIRNLTILASLYEISKVRISEDYPKAVRQIQESFPLIDIEYISEAKCNRAMSLSRRRYGALSYTTTAMTNFI